MAEYKTKVQQHKTDSVADIKAQLETARDYVFTDYRGLTVEQITNLRARLREANADYKVVKNRFARIAFQQMDKPAGVDEFLVGPTAIALAQDDSGAVAKALFAFAKDAPVSVKGALVGESVFNATETEDYSKLPGREELLAMLMSTMNAPMQNFVYALNGITTKLVRTVQAIADAKAG